MIGNDLFLPRRSKLKPGCALAPAGSFLAAILLTVCAPASQAQLTTIAYDSFSYNTGPLSGQNGGTGWTSAWTHTYSSGADFNVSATGLSYTGLTSTGGSMVWNSGGNGISEAARALPLQDSGIVYLQFLSVFGSGSSGGGTPNLRLLDSGAVTGGFGSNGGSLMSILGSSLEPNSDSSSVSSISLTGLDLVVARIDYQDNSTMMWVNPNLSTFNYQNPTAPSAVYAGLAPVFNSIDIVSRNPATVDEITVSQQTVPEPASTAVIGLGLVLWGLRRRCQSR